MKSFLFMYENMGGYPTAVFIKEMDETKARDYFFKRYAILAKRILLVRNVSE